ncbi:NmrA/HSCARG family protein [Streptomyces sp. NPDC091215]|uniref:NmrA/HSCARG family protein n=1 Tax=Streptomyces sp. NPDC091215 TaxID=3155192 RepID=UPI0034367928
MHVAVLGATGGQGGAVVSTLLDSGQRVRAVVRNPVGARAQALEELGVEVVRGDLRDVPSLVAAFGGMDAAFAVTTPFEEGPQAEVDQGLTIIAAARQVKLAHLVLSSVASADRSTGVPHFESKYRIEQALRQESDDWTIVAPTYFYDNMLGDVENLRAGRLVLPYPVDRPLQQVARQDLAAVVAAAVVDRAGHLRRRIEVASDAPSPARMAAALTRSLASPVEAVRTPLDLRRRSSDDMVAMWAFLNEEGYTVDITALHRTYPAISWTTFDDWAQQLSRNADS